MLDIGDTLAKLSHWCLVSLFVVRIWMGFEDDGNLEFDVWRGLIGLHHREELFSWGALQLCKVSRWLVESCIPLFLSSCLCYPHLFALSTSVRLNCLVTHPQRIQGRLQCLGKPPLCPPLPTDDPLCFEPAAASRGILCAKRVSTCCLCGSARCTRIRHSRQQTKRSTCERHCVRKA